MSKKDKLTEKERREKAMQVFSHGRGTSSRRTAEKKQAIADEPKRRLTSLRTREQKERDAVIKEEQQRSSRPSRSSGLLSRRSETSQIASRQDVENIRKSIRFSDYFGTLHVWICLFILIPGALFVHMFLAPYPYPTSSMTWARKVGEAFKMGAANLLCSGALVLLYIGFFRLRYTYVYVPKAIAIRALALGVSIGMDVDDEVDGDEFDNFEESFLVESPRPRPKATRSAQKRSATTDADQMLAFLRGESDLLPLHGDAPDSYDSLSAVDGEPYEMSWIAVAIIAFISTAFSQLIGIGWWALAVCGCWIGVVYAWKSFFGNRNEEYLASTSASKHRQKKKKPAKKAQPKKKKTRKKKPPKLKHARDPAEPYEPDTIAKRNIWYGLTGILGVSLIAEWPIYYAVVRKLGLPFLSLQFWPALVLCVLGSIALFINMHKGPGWCLGVSLVSVFIVFPAFLFIGTGLYFRYQWYPTYVVKAKEADRVKQRYEVLRGRKETFLYDYSDIRLMSPYTGLKSSWRGDKITMKLPVTKVVLASEGDIDYNQCKGNISCMVLTPAFHLFVKMFNPGKKKLNCQPLSPDGLARIPLQAYRGTKSGGSNPVQQLAKTYYCFKRTKDGNCKQMRSLQKKKMKEKKKRKNRLARKVDIAIHKFTTELATATVLCEQFSKLDVMRLYFNGLYYGKGDQYGLQYQSTYYFAKQPEKLNFYESVIIAAGLPNPAQLNPWFLKSCRTGYGKGKCKRGSRRWRKYREWRKRIRNVIANVRKSIKPQDRSQFLKDIKAAGHHNDLSKPFGISLFRDGLDKKGVELDLARNTRHGIHLRKYWITPVLEREKIAKAAQSGYRIYLTYSKKLRASIDAVRKTALAEFRSLLKQSDDTKPEQDKVQVAFTITNAQTGEELVREGGDLYVDMNTAPKSGMGSVYKIMTLLVLSQFWPNGIPFINYGVNRKQSCGGGPEKCTQVRYFYGTRSYYKSRRLYDPKNDHGMRPYVDKVRALAKSANIGFVFLSLRYIHFLNNQKKRELFTKSLENMYLQKHPNATYKEAAEKVAKMFAEGGYTHLERFIKRTWDGYLLCDPLQRQKAAFEAAKAATLAHFRSQVTVYNTDAGFTPLGISLAELVGSNPAKGLSPKVGEEVKKVFDQKLSHFQMKYSGPVTTEEALYYPRLSVVLGLQYLEHMTRKIMGIRMPRGKKVDGWQAAPGMTLGTGSFTIRNMLRIPMLVVSNGQGGLPYIVRSVESGEPGKKVGDNKSDFGNIEVLYDHASKKLPVRSWVKLIPSDSFRITQRAMAAVASSGTAYRAYRELKNHFGDKFSTIRSGFKTGTANDVRGVACSGFLEDTSTTPSIKLAGALTISTPSNKTLAICRYSDSSQYRLCYGRKRYQYLRRNGMVGRLRRRGKAIGSWRACKLLGQLLAKSHDFIVKEPGFKVKLAKSVQEYMKKRKADALLGSDPKLPADEPNDGYEFDISKMKNPFADDPDFPSPKSPQKRSNR